MTSASWPLYKQQVIIITISDLLGQKKSSGKTDASKSAFGPLDAGAYWCVEEQGKKHCMMHIFCYELQIGILFGMG